MANTETVSVYDMSNVIREAVLSNFTCIENFSGIEINNDEDMGDALDIIDTHIEKMSTETLSKLYVATLNNEPQDINWSAYRQ